MDPQDHSNGGPFAYIGVTALGAILHWLFQRMLKLKRPKEPFTFTVNAWKQIDCRFKSLESQLEALAATLEGQNQRIGAMERHRSSPAFGDILPSRSPESGD